MSRRSTTSNTLFASLLVLPLAAMGCGGGGGFSGPMKMAPGRISSAPMAPSSADMSYGSGVTRAGSQDNRYFASRVRRGDVPRASDLTVEGAFAEHDTHLPRPMSDRALTLHPLLGVSVDPRTNAPAAVLQLGMNSQLDFTGVPRLPMNLVVVIDKSGSMTEDQKMEHVKDGLRMLLDSIGPTDTLSIVVYDSSAEVLAPPTTGDQKRVLGAVIDSIYPGGATNIHDGLVLGYQQAIAAYDEKAVNRVLLLSDGVPTVGVANSEGILAEVARQSRGFNVGLSAVGVGKDYNRELMVSLANQGGGNTYFLDNAAEVKRVFVDELETLLTPIAEDVELRLELAEGVEMKASHGIPLTIGKGGHPELVIEALYLSRRNGVMLVELDIDGIDRRSGYVGKVVFEYTITTTNLRERAEYPVTLPPRSWDADNTSGYFEHPSIRKNFDILMAVYGMQDACAMYHEGDIYGATNMISSVEGWLAQEARDTESPGLARELTRVRKLSSAIARR